MPERPWSGDWLFGMGVEPGRRVLNGGQWNRYAAPIRPGDVISVSRRFVDVVERETKRGPMVFFTSEFRWANQDGAPRPPRGADHHLLLRSSHRDVEDLGSDVEGVVRRRHPGVDSDLHQYLDQFLLRDAEVAGPDEVAA